MAFRMMRKLSEAQTSDRIDMIRQIRSSAPMTRHARRGKTLLPVLSRLNA
ncbi:hypothetical protein [Novosphingobium sp. 9]|nr:hypothetical protein [Novosphingobium sp. 9]